MNNLNEFLDKIGATKVVGIVKNHEQNMSAKLLHMLLSAHEYNSVLITDKFVFNRGYLVDLSSQTAIDKMSTVLTDPFEYCIIDISLENIQQNIFNKLNYSGGVFTGLEKSLASKELDFQTQRDSVKSFFDQLPKKTFALTNLDDRNGEFIMQNTKAKKHSYSQKKMADFKVKILEKNHFGSRLNLDGEEVWVTTKHENECVELHCTYAIARLLGIDKIDILVFLSSITAKSGSIARNLNESSSYI